MANKWSPGCACCGCTILAVVDWLEHSPNITPVKDPLSEVDGFRVHSKVLPSDGNYTVVVRPKFTGYLPTEFDFELALIKADGTIFSRFGFHTEWIDRYVDATNEFGADFHCPMTG